MKKMFHANLRRRPKKNGLHAQKWPNFANFAFHLKRRANFHKFCGKDQNKQKKSLHPKTYLHFMNYGVKPPKQTVFISKSTKKPFLLTISGVTSSILGVSGLELHSSSTEPVNIHGAQSSLEEARFLFGGAQAVIWGGTAPECPPRGAGLDAQDFKLENTTIFLCQSLCSNQYPTC